MENIKRYIDSQLLKNKKGNAKTWLDDKNEIETMRKIISEMGHPSAKDIISYFKMVHGANPKKVRRILSTYLNIEWVRNKENGSFKYGLIGDLKHGSLGRDEFSIFLGSLSLTYEDAANIILVHKEL